ncbi:MAG: hypothetical protein V1773_13100 [bacterium]
MADPYSRNLIQNDFYYSKTELIGKFVVVLDGKLENRGLNLIKPISRVFTKGTIIELIGTDDKNAGPGKDVDNIAYIGFLELKNGGVVIAGDELVWNGQIIGTIAGFDDTHMPNHQNTIIKVEKRIPGKDLGIKINDELIIKGFTKK